MDPVREKLQQLDQKAEELQKASKYGESLDVLEEILNLKRNHYGEDSDEYFRTSEKLCELCNLISMICLQKEKFEASLKFLKKAEILCSQSFTFKAITYNNLACYYRRTNKLRTAQQYLEKALEIEVRMDNPKSLADTHLNMCAVLSQLDHHSEALEHVLLSIVLLQDEFMEIQTKKFEEFNLQDQSISAENHHPNNKDNPANTQKDRIAVLAIAYHNMGVELEYLKRYEEAIQTYQKAVKFSIKNLGEDHQLVENLRNVLAQAQQQIQTQKNKEQRKKENKILTQNKKENQKLSKVHGLYQPPQNANNNDNKKNKSQINFNPLERKSSTGNQKSPHNVQYRPIQTNDLNQQHHYQDEQQDDDHFPPIQ